MSKNKVGQFWQLPRGQTPSDTKLSPEDARFQNNQRGLQELPLGQFQSQEPTND